MIYMSLIVFTIQVKTFSTVEPKQKVRIIWGSYTKQRLKKSLHGFHLEVALQLLRELMFLQLGETFAQYKALRVGTQTLATISTSTGVQRISTEYHHVFITQRVQKAYDLPNWMVNNRLNVWKLNTVQHSLIDPYRYNFLRAGFKPSVGWTGKYNWFTKF